MIKTKRKKGGFHYSIRIYGKGKEYLEILNEIFSKNFEIKGKIFEDKRKKDTCFLKIQNASIFFYFMINENEIGKKRRFKIPEIIKENPKYFKEYLSGLVDTDGHISRKRIQLKQKSEKLLKEIMVISNKQNLNCTIPKVNYTNKKPYYYIRFDNKIPLRFKTNNFLKQNK